MSLNVGQLSFLRRLAAGLAVLGMIALFMTPTAVSAAVDPFQGACGISGAGGPACGGGGGADPIAGPNGAIVRVTGIMALVVGIVSVIFVIWGGIKYITANGDSSSVATAKSTIIYALIGLVIAALARPMINFVLSRI